MNRKRKLKRLSIVLTILLLIIAGIFTCYVLKLKNQLSQQTEGKKDAVIQQEEVPEPTVEPTAEPTPEATPEPTPEPVVKLSLSQTEPGDILTPEQMQDPADTYFQAYPILEGDPVFNRINGQSYRENDNVALADLRYLKMLHYNFQHQIQVGEMIVNVAVAEDVLNIFKEFFRDGYEIQSMFLIDNYWQGDGDSSDNASIQVNNTSAFCYREATNTTKLSYHAYGLAIDINPQQNPYVWYENGQQVCYHENAVQYLDRNCGDPHMVAEGDYCYSVFAKYGFTWGGSWKDPIDYQHFEKRLF